MKKLWNKYIVSYEDYFNGLTKGLLEKSNGVNDNFLENVQNCQKPIEQLASKYQIKNKSILSIAPGVGFEEYWFWKNDNILTFIDLDDQNVIQGYLKKLPEIRGGLTYYIGDAYAHKKDLLEHGFDVCYFSSFAPDEIRRKSIISQYTKGNLNVFFSKAVGKLFRSLNIPKHVNVRNWPSNAYPLDDLIIEYLDQYLASAGLFIHQTYNAPIDFVSNPHAITLIRQQLARAGVQLVKIYHFQSPLWYFKCHLIVGYKGTHEEALKYIKDIETNPDITIFNGRSYWGREGGEIATAFELSA